MICLQPISCITNAPPFQFWFISFNLLTFVVLLSNIINILLTSQQKVSFRNTQELIVVSGEAKWKTIEKGSQQSTCNNFMNYCFIMNPYSLK